MIKERKRRKNYSTTNGSKVMKGQTKLPTKKVLNQVQRNFSTACKA